MRVQDQVLSAVFGAARIKTAQLGRLELFAPWGAQVKPQSDLLLHHVLEGSAWLRAGTETQHLRAGDVSNPGLARAIASIHARPSEPWSVEALAREAGMSRSAFAEVFTRCVGEGAIRYLTLWRLALAEDLLTSTTLGVEAIANQVGYANAAAFSTAFRREFGVSPGSLRRR